MPLIPEPHRARLFTALSKSLGDEEAQTLSTALNLDGQLATRDELRTEIMSVREEIREGFAGVDRRFADADQRMTTGFAAADQRMTTGFADAARGLADLEVKLGATTRSLFFQVLGLQLSAAAIVFAFLKLL